MSDEIINLASKIKESYKCKCCGGTTTNGVCIYCGSLNEEFYTLVEELNHKIDNIDISKVNQISDVMNAIYTLKEMEIEKVDSLLLKTNYEQIIKNKRNEICKKTIDDVILTIDDCKNFEFLFENYEKEENKMAYCNYVFKSILQDKSNFSYEFFEKIVVYFTENFSKELGIKCRTIIDNLDENTAGFKSYNYVFLDKKGLDDFYYNQNPDLLGTIFHEVTHLVQDKRQKNNKIVSLSDYIQIKEKIIMQLDRDFYDENYINITFENEARLNGGIYLIRYLKNIFNMSFTKEDEKEELERINLTIMQNEDLLRTYKGSNASVLDIFDEIIVDNPDYLEKYPSLNCEYKLSDDGQVIRKNYNEISGEFLNRNFNVYDKPELKTLSDLYVYIMKVSKNKESSITY